MSNEASSNKVATMTPPNESKSSGPLVVDSNRPVSILSRSASANNIENMSHNDTLHPARPTVEWNYSGAGLIHARPMEDPFLSTPDRPRSTASNVSVTPTPQNRVHTVQAAATPAQDFSPREDRLQQPITPANAQGRFAPEACVFVAK